MSHRIVPGSRNARFPALLITLTIIGLLVVAILLSACNPFSEPPPPPTTIEEIENLDNVEFYSDGTKLVGRLLVPEGEGPFPAIVLVHSSGRATRHDNDPLPDLLQASGFAILSYDKRGVGASKGGYLDVIEGGVEISEWRIPKQALRVAQDVGARFAVAHALTIQGHALVGLGHLEAAAAAYGHALDLQRERGRPNLVMECRAGLARVSLEQGDLAQAQTFVEEILAHLETGTLHRTYEPFRVYLTCYQTLKAGQDPQAQEILATAYNLLQEWAARIDDGAVRRSFLENVPAHREIMSERVGKVDRCR